MVCDWLIDGCGEEPVVANRLRGNVLGAFSGGEFNDCVRIGGCLDDVTLNDNDRSSDDLRNGDLVGRSPDDDDLDSCDLRVAVSVGDPPACSLPLGDLGGLWRGGVAGRDAGVDVPEQGISGGERCLGECCW